MKLIYKILVAAAISFSALACEKPEMQPDGTPDTGVTEKPSLEVGEGEWGDGQVVIPDSDLSGTVSVDIVNSDIPENVSVYREGDWDVVEVPYLATEMLIALAADSELELLVEDAPEGMTIEPQVSQNMDLEGRLFRITLPLRPPGSEDTDLPVYVKYKRLDNVYDKIVFRLQRNANVFDGLFDFKGTLVSDLGRYVDNEIGTVQVSEGKKLELRFPEGEHSWMQAREVGDSDGVYRILAGWRPNDETADGRDQAAYIVISDPDGANEEVYTVIRKNWGLPVVLIGDTWWCKYNLRGNLKSFSDQITVASDPARAAGKSVAEYLSECSDEELLAAIGDQYQPGSYEGMRLYHDGAGFRYEGYRSSGVPDIGVLPAGEMAPEGYELPEGDDFNFFSTRWGISLNTGPGSYSNGYGYTMDYNVTSRSFSLDGNEYGDIYVYDFNIRDSQEHLVLNGLGHQWAQNTGSLIPQYIIFGIFKGSYSNISAWVIMGPESTGNTTSRFGRVDHYSSKTRTLRCIKSPVEYIY